ncbi:WxcM-like domain-containing protein [Pedobacter sp. HMF7647]|uniref:WxcM-like domain-containing protein n=1 Tax=Hufsiella arboris TaxID=2695275 RepID=A0A7K1YE27_9SPHI|nr:FdtA/QdtA family cupin domain-containing protein [Hufsiella arboris]MXV52832.1 WxcM-like domain-containing protein [Hufsiella arboris]
MSQPYLIQFESIGSSELGFISVGQEFENIPFSIKRTYWTYYTPQSIKRGGHANIDKELVLVAVSGNIRITTELIDGSRAEFKLESPDVGLYLPKLCWHTMQYSHSAVQLVIASNEYDEADYIRDYNQFINYFAIEK